MTDRQTCESVTILYYKDTKSIHEVLDVPEREVFLRRLKDRKQVMIIELAKQI
jgi:hypothetical protein